MKKLLILTIAIFCSGITVQAQSYKIIVNKSNSVSTLSAKDVSDLFLKKNLKWSTGHQVVPIDLSSNNSTRAEFSKSVLKKSVSAVRSYWQQAVFAGKNTPPVEKKTDEEVIDFVKRNSGAIGYVSSSANISEVKELKVSN